jgi:trigger factor
VYEAGVGWPDPQSSSEEARVKTSVERVDDTTVKLSVTVDAQRVRKALDDAGRKLSQEVKVPGFRPGKAPRRIIESRLGKDALVEEALREALPTFYAEAAEAEDLRVVGPPEFDVGTFTEGEDAEFTATVEVRPEITLPELSAIQVPHPEWEVTDEEVDGQLDELRERFAELETVERPVQAGDFVVVSITGARHGEQVEEASVEDTLYEVNEPSEDGPTLDRELVGAKAGAILKFNDTLGEDFGEELAGQELAFTAIVKEVKTKLLPELDDDFAVTASEFDTIDELRADLREQLQGEKLSWARQALRGRVVEAVAEQVEVPIPQAMVQQEVRFRLSRLAQQAQAYGMSLDEYFQAAGLEAQETLDRLEAEARETVKAQLIVDTAGNEAGVEVEEADLVAEVERQAARFGHDPNELASFMTETPERLGALYSDAFRRKAIDHIIEQVQILSAPPDDPVTEEPADEDKPEGIVAEGRQEEEGQ